MNFSQHYSPMQVIASYLFHILVKPVYFRTVSVACTALPKA